MPDNQSPVCDVHKDWPDHCYAICSCGYKGSPHVFFWRAKRDAVKHCFRRGHVLGDMHYVRKL